MICQREFSSLVGLVLVIGCTSGPDMHSVFDGSAGEWIDLTHTLSEDAVFWPTAAPFEMEEVAFGVTEAGYFYSAYNLFMAEHGGTHLDAPVHFAEGRQAADEIPIDRLIGPAVVIDISDNVSPDYLITVEDIESWESQFQTIPDGAIVLFHTGWGNRWPDAERYLGTAQRGPDAVPLLHFPGISPTTAQWLVDHRLVDAVGIDTPSLDYGQSTTFETHQILYGENVPGLENVANLSSMPSTGAFVVALPAKIKGGSGAPLRIVAFVPN